jgi:hypothetical protein
MTMIRPPSASRCGRLTQRHEDRARVHREHRAEVGIGGLRDRHGEPDARIADHHAEPAQVLPGCIEQPPQLPGVSNVGLHRDGPSAVRSDRRDDLLGRAPVGAVVDQHATSIRGQPGGDRCPDAAGAPGDQSRLSWRHHSSWRDCGR